MFPCNSFWIFLRSELWPTSIHHGPHNKQIWTWLRIFSLLWNLPHEYFNFCSLCWVKVSFKGSLVFRFFRKNQPVVYPKAILPGLISGLMWAIAQTCWFIANENLEMVVAFPLISTGNFGQISLIRSSGSCCKPLGNFCIQRNSWSEKFCYSYCSLLSYCNCCCFDISFQNRIEEEINWWFNLATRCHDEFRGDSWCFVTLFHIAYLWANSNSINTT